MRMIHIDGRTIGPGQPCFVIAEAGVNHNGDPALAHRLIDEAAAAGADAVKFQTFSASRLVSPTAPKADYQQRATGASESQYDMLRRLELADPVYADLAAHCRRVGVTFLSTPFDERSVDVLAALDIAAFKIPSGEITNTALLRHIASKGRPVLLSTGMSNLDEVHAAVAVLRSAGATDIVLLHCVSQYPAPPSDANLRAMATMAAATSLAVGYSDHTEGTDVAIAAVALGAVVLEKHVTLSRQMEGPDHGSSLEPDELARLVRGVRNVEAALGHGRKEPAPGEAAIAAVARRSLVAVCPIAAGTVLTADLVAVMRPGTGLPPHMLPQILGRRVKTAVDAGTPISLDVLA